MNRPTITQLVLGVNDAYLDYDFESRKARRRSAGKEYIDRDVCRRNLLDVKAVLDKHNIKFWLVYGTLLGATREGDFIAHDTDTDLGVYEEDRKQFIIALKEILGLGFKLIRTRAPDDRATIMREDEYIDFGIFRVERDDRGREYYVYQDNREYGQSFETLKPQFFLDEEFLVPTAAEELLLRWYGKDWRRPKAGTPAWPFDYPFYKKLLYGLAWKFNIISIIRRIKRLINGQKK